MTAVARTRAELVAALAAPHTTRAVVMTMGALHAGHLSLVHRARELADQVVVTVFVNPLQFGPGEDLDRYPRDLDGDLAQLTEAGADVVFAPDVDEMFPGGPPAVTVRAGPIGDVLEGATRPGHFDGVLTIVLRLLHLVAPDVALFGRKDAQQVMAVRQMVVDLDVPVRIEACPTVREADGLALSSRNAYLDREQRETARALYLSLRAGARAVEDGAGPDRIRRAVGEVLACAPLAVDYVALVDPVTARDVAEDHRGAAVLAVAARVGTTRLIDNVELELRGGEGR